GRARGGAGGWGPPKREGGAAKPRRPCRLPMIAPLARRTTASIAAEPIPNADHAKPPPVLTVVDAGETAQLPAWYFLFSASLWSISARDSARFLFSGSWLYAPR